jgi:light-regulated signal transduction histidine kinase (bacteriophytochrome)
MNAPIRDSGHRLAVRVRQLARRNELLERKLADYEAWTYVMAHDLRGPLMVMNGLAQGLASSDAVTDRGARAQLQRIVVSVRFIDQMIDTALAAANAAREERPFQPLDVARMVRQLLVQTPLRERMRKTPVRVHPLPGIAGNPVIVRQVFLHLLLHVAHWDRTGAQQSAIELYAEEKGCERVFSLSYGFSTEDPAYPHVQIAKRLLERHGGWLAIESMRDGLRKINFTFRANVA